VLPHTGSDGLVNVGSAIFLDVVLQHRRHARHSQPQRRYQLASLPSYSMMSILREVTRAGCRRCAAQNLAVPEPYTIILSNMFRSCCSSEKRIIGRARECRTSLRGFRRTLIGVRYRRGIRLRECTDDKSYVGTCLLKSCLNDCRSKQVLTLEPPPLGDPCYPFDVRGL
jgi:hypothetical protein